jgi:hypothetical protein
LTLKEKANKSLAAKVERATGPSAQVLTEDAIVRSKAFQSVL